jgi:hypothetical protein
MTRHPPKKKVKVRCDGSDNHPGNGPPEVLPAMVPWRELERLARARPSGSEAICN